MLPFGFQTATRNTKTFPAFLPLRSLDAIYFRGDVRLHHAFAGHTEISRYASDHLPLVADLELHPPSGA
jgi:endonuclease/exonuclease/phosphatase family metal-dependent hydrolase